MYGRKVPGVIIRGLYSKSMSGRNGSIVNDMRVDYFERNCPDVCTLRSLKTKKVPPGNR